MTKKNSKNSATVPAGVPLRAGPPPKKASKPESDGLIEFDDSGDDDGHKRPRGDSAKKGPQRVQRLLAAAGFGSRRNCEEMITEGRVVVDGVPITELGTQVDPQVSKVYVDGTLLKKQRLVYFLLNKPPGVVTTNSDPQGRTRVTDLIQEPERIFPVGRLDRNSEGLLLLTNDGDLAQQLAHPKYGVRKIYRVTVAGKVDSPKLAEMKKGIYIAEGHVAVDGATIIRHRAKSTDLEITLREGKNREIRRILARLGHKVMTLQRVALGPLRLGDLPRGLYRPLRPEELKRLREEVFYQSKAVRESGGKGKPAGAGKKKSARNGAPKRPGATGGTRPANTGESRPAKPIAKPIAKPQVLGESNRVGTVIGEEVKPATPKLEKPKRDVIRKASDVRKQISKKKREDRR